MSAGKGHTAVVELLLGLHSDINQRDERGSSALHAACARSHVAVVELLLEKGSAVEAASADG